MQRIVAFLKDSRGSVIALTAFLLFVAVMILAVVIDLGHVQAVRNEVANAADSGALAGARGLWPMPPNEVVAIGVDADCPGAVTRALAAIQANYADKAHILQVGANDIQVGKWDISKPPSPANFVPGCSADANAVKVRLYKNEALNNPISLGFARFFYGESISVWAEAIAYTGFAGEMAPGCALPVGIPMCSDNEPTHCPYEIQFTNDNTDTSAWHTFDLEHANANCIRYILSNCVFNCPNDLTREPHLQWGCPPSEIYVNNGEINSALQTTYDKFRANMVPDGSSSTGYSWLTQILLLSCGEGPCEQCGDPGVNCGISDWKAIKTLHLRGIRCFKVTDVGAAGGGRVALNPLDKDKKFIKGCIVDNDDCTIMAPPEGSGPQSALPKLVWTDSNYISRN